jgi:hypothetical protein
MTGTTRRYVIQQHTLRGVIHYDFMFEVAGQEKLRTFQIFDEPDTDGAAAGMTIREIAAHRCDYLEYEGEVSGGRGYVEIWDAGVLVASNVASGAIRLHLVSAHGRTHSDWMLTPAGGTGWHLMAAGAVRAVM